MDHNYLISSFQGETIIHTIPVIIQICQYEEKELSEKQDFLQSYPVEES